jgi:CP family cyanate transporter-like MFS transporter
MTTEPTDSPYRWAILGGVWLLYFCFGILIAAMAPLVEPISDDLGLSRSAMGMAFGAWPLVYIGVAIPSGILLDRIGARRALFVAGIIMGVSGLLRGVAVDHLTLVLAVGVFGLGGPLVSIGAPKLISLWFEGRDRGLAMGIYITGPALGGVFALSMTNSVMMPFFDNDWRAVLIAYSSFVAIASFGWLLIASHPDNRAMEALLRTEVRRPQLEIFADLIRVPVVRIVLVMSIFIFFFNHGLNNWLPEILRDGGMDRTTAGFWAALPTAIGVIGSLTVPRLATPERRMLVLALLFSRAGAATILLHSDAKPVIACGLIFMGITRGAMMTVALLTLVEVREVGSRNAGSAGGLFFSAAEIGGVLGPVTIGFVADATDGFGAALNLMTGICGVLLLLSLLMRRITRTRT